MENLSNILNSSNTNLVVSPNASNKKKTPSKNKENSSVNSAKKNKSSPRKNEGIIPKEMPVLQDKDLNISANLAETTEQTASKEILSPDNKNLPGDGFKFINKYARPPIEDSESGK